MAFGDELIEKASATADIAALNAQIEEEKERADENCLQLGRLYAEKYAKNPEEEFATLVEKIVESLRKIRTCQDQILDIKGVRVCESCGCEVAKNIAFCSECGAPLPVEQPEGTNKCGKCGAFMAQNIKFCTACGTLMTPAAVEAPAAAPAVEPAPAFEPAPAPAAAVCAVCGQELIEGMLFCTGCGTPVSAAPAAAPAVAPAPAFEPAPVVEAVPAQKTCAVCGQVLEDGMLFCTGCGTPVSAAPAAAPAVEPAPAFEPAPVVEAVPNQKTCAVCGQVLEDGMLFCTGCGTPVSAAPAAAPAVEPAPAFEPAPVVEAVPTQKTCAVCGQVLEDGMLFCVNCGTMVGAAPAPAAPVQKTCANCGMPLEEDMLFCTNCGTRI